MSETITDFLSGAITLGCVVLGLFFLRFWRRTHDALFVNFAAAFGLLALNQAAATLSRASEETSWIYLTRLAAFLIIIAAIVHKNLTAQRRI